MVSESNAAIDLIFAFTGKLYDENTKLQNNLNRWFDPAVGQWISEDPIQFLAGDENLKRYVGNKSSTKVDKNGLVLGIVTEVEDISKPSLTPHVQPKVSGPGVWIYTGDWETTLDIYEAATGAGGDSYIENKDLAHGGLQLIDVVDPTGIAVALTLY